MSDDVTASGSVAPPPPKPPLTARTGTAAVRHWLIGPAPVSRLTITHCLHASAEAFFVVSMAGSIFFSVSVDAARPRVLLFLVLTLAPFLVMAPLVGPIVDRIRGGLPAVMISTFLIRLVLALLLAENLRTLALFPLAFGMLVVSKTYSVSRNAMVPTLVDDGDDLVPANSRLSRSATMLGAVAGATAVTVYSTTSAEWALRAGAVVYLLGAFAAWRVRAVARPIEPVDPAAIIELIKPDVSGAMWDMMALRAAIGFAFFQFAFSLRADGAEPWVLGAVIVANGIGGFVGTVISPWLRRTMSERAMFTTALSGAAMAALLAGLVLRTFTLVLAIFVLGLAASVGRRALDATVQRQAPHARRGRIYAGLETRLELAWVTAACLAVASRVATWIGTLALATFLVFAAVIHLRRHAGLGILHPMAAVSLPERLLIRAESLAAHGFHDEAFVVANATVQVIDVTTTPEPAIIGRTAEEARAEIARARALLASSADRGSTGGGQPVRTPGDDLSG